MTNERIATHLRPIGIGLLFFGGALLGAFGCALALALLPDIPEYVPVSVFGVALVVGAAYTIGLIWNTRI